MRFAGRRCHGPEVIALSARHPGPFRAVAEPTASGAVASCYLVGSTTPPLVPAMNPIAITPV